MIILHIHLSIRSSHMNYFIYTSHHFTSYGKIWAQLIDLASNVWLHSSVGIASRRDRGGHGFESCWGPDFFQASSFHGQLFKLENILRWSFFTFLYFVRLSSIGFHCIICFKLSMNWLQRTWFEINNPRACCILELLTMTLFPAVRSELYLQVTDLLQANHYV